MNGRKAKELRKAAEYFASNAPARNSVTMRNGQAINSPYSTRALYQRLKKEGAHHAIPGTRGRGQS